MFGGRDFGEIKPMFVCTECGSRMTPVEITQGSIGMEILLWLVFLVPGFIYSLWRLASRKKVCPKCSSDKFVPVTTPKGQALLKQFKL